MSFIITYIIPVSYMILLAFMLIKFQWINKAGFGKKFIVAAFILKCLVGFLYNYIAFGRPSDIWQFYNEGQEMYHAFLQSPSLFFKTYAQYFAYSDVNVLSTSSDFIRSAFDLIKIFHFILDFFSLGNMYTNTIFFNFISLLCILYCWRFFKQKLGNQGLYAGVAFFFLPSMLFYSSTIGKEGIVACLLCILIPLSYKIITAQLKWKIAVQWFILFLFLFTIKFFVAIFWITCLLLWKLLYHYPRKRSFIVPIFLITIITLFFTTKYIHSSIDLPYHFAHRQQEFLELPPAASAIPVSILSPHPISFLTAFPVASNNVLFKPLPGEGGKSFYFLYTLEICAFWLFIAYIIVTKNKNKHNASKENTTMAICFLLFSLFNLLSIGYIVPNIGTIVRYRSIFLPFFLLSVFIICNWSPSFKISNYINRIVSA